MSPCPMFPLGSVVVPTQRVPLQLFEPRYLALIEDVLAGDRRFGTCLIERGSEVGGGDSRLPVGTMVEVVDARRVPDGRWLVEGVGVERVRVGAWMPDDPYPRADVEPHPDPQPGPAEVALVDEVREQLCETVGQLVEERGGQVPDGWLSELVDDPTLASFQLVDNAPFGPFDRYRLLAADTLGLRLALLSELLAEIGARRDGG